MKYLLSSVAIVAALAVVAPASAQRSGPGAGAATGTGPDVNPPGGPGPSQPYYNLPPGSPGIPGTPSSGPATRTYPAPAAAAPGVAPGMAPGAETTSATPPTHRHARPHHGHVAAHTTTKGAPVSGNPNLSANQMNADELARLQAGETGNPPPSALPYSEPPSAQADTGRGPGRQLRSLNAPGR